MLTNEQQLAIDKFKKLKVGALFMKQGTGKTRVALELIKTTNATFILFVSPCSVKTNLQAEINKWGINKKYLIIGYETLSLSDATFLNVLERVKKEDEVFIVADESLFIKNDNSKRFDRMKKLAACSKYRLILNGTPITKNEWDIYNQMNFLSPLIIGMDREEFLNTFFKHIRFRKRNGKKGDFYQLSEVNIDYLHKLIEPYVFECDFTFDQDITNTHILIPASKAAEDNYLFAREQLLEALVNGNSKVELFTNLALACFDDKERHVEIAKHLKGQMIVYCSLLSEVQHITNEIDCYVITGETKNREEIREKFKHDNKPLIMTYGVGAFGLNLQFCNKIAFASLVFDYGKLDQAMMRIQRLGQERDIEYVYFTSDLKVYGFIEDNIKKKIRLHDLIIKQLEAGENIEKLL